MSNRDSNDDFTNPMHGRGDDLLPITQPMRKHTMMYSYVNEDEAKKRHGGTAAAALAAAVAPTEMMPAVIHIPDPPATVKQIVSEIMERDINAWTALPQSVRDMMLSNPEKFTLTPNKAYPNDVPSITYGGVQFKWLGQDDWVIVGLHKV